MTRTRNELAQLAAGLLGTAVRTERDTGEGNQLTAQARVYVDEAWQGGRDEAGRELADVLGGLIEAGLILDDPAIAEAFGPLIPEPDPGSHGDRLLEAARSEAVSPIMASQKDPDWTARPEEAAGVGRHVRRDTPPGQVTGVREVSPAEAARLLGLFGERYPELAEFARQHAGLSTKDLDVIGCPDRDHDQATSFGGELHDGSGGGRAVPSVGYPDSGRDQAESFDAVLHYGLGSERPLPRDAVPDSLVTDAEDTAADAAVRALTVPGRPSHDLAGLPLADDDSETQADAAQQRSGFSTLPGTEAARAIDDFLDRPDETGFTRDRPFREDAP